MRSCCREKVFGPGRAVPLDRNAKCRVLAYAAGYNARHRQPGQHIGPITRTSLDVLEALLRSFHNSHTGACFPSYEAIAAKADCDRSTVYEAIKVLEWARVLTWRNRIVRIQVRERDLFGRWASHWRVLRTSNAYVFNACVCTLHALRRQMRRRMAVHAAPAGWSLPLGPPAQSVAGVAMHCTAMPRPMADRLQRALAVAPRHCP